MKLTVRKGKRAGQPGRLQLVRAAKALRAGKLVAFPTETVYGLGANGLDPEAVARIFEVKRRPRTSPVILHVDRIEAARELVTHWPDSAQRLAEAFWPGPLTLVLPRREVVPDIVTGGGNYVGVRMPNHPVALSLLAAAGVPVAAPSANRFTQISPTSAQHVRRGLGSDVDVILDGGPSAVGIESSVLALYEDGPVLLRPGGVSREEIEAVLGMPVGLPGSAPAKGETHDAPGMHFRHYSPRTMTLTAHPAMTLPPGTGVLITHRPAHYDGLAVAHLHLMPAAPDAYARQLYAVLHELDAQSYDWIAIDLPPDEPAWMAVRDRLKRAIAR
jgi:L-threonylcarbamoyladenylate synthase